MEFSGKPFDWYWKIIKIPVYVLIGWAVLGFIVALISFSTYISIFSQWSGTVLTLAVFGFLGWTTIKDFKIHISQTAWAGAIAGFLAGLVSAVLYVLLINLAPQIISMMLTQVPKGVDPSSLEGMVKIGAYVGLVTGPLINAAIGALVSALVAWIATKVK